MKVSCWDFFATLTGGGRLCLASRDHLLTDLTSVMRDMDIQVSYQYKFNVIS